MVKHIRDVRLNSWPTLVDLQSKRKRLASCKINSEGESPRMFVSV